MDDQLKALIEDLKTQRDELRVQMHLAAAELKDEWEVAEKKWQQFEHKLEDFAGEAEEKGEELKKTWDVVADELGTAYQRIRSRLNE